MQAKFKIVVIALVVAIFSQVAMAKEEVRPIKDLKDLIYRMEGEESGHKQSPKGHNDGGRARGWLQIQKPFYIDSLPAYEKK